MYYIEQICTPGQMVRVTIHPEEITRPLMYRKYKKATPGNPLMIERLDGCMVYVDACETWAEATERAEELARQNGTGYQLGPGLQQRGRRPEQSGQQPQRKAWTAKRGWPR